MGIIRMEHEQVYEDNLNTHIDNVTQNYMQLQTSLYH